MNFVKTFALWELLKGLRVTSRTSFKKSVTLEYPEEKTPQSPRFRGLHALRRYPNGEERCIACKLCEAVFKCIYCGFCEEACPVDAIVETRIHEYHMENPGENIMTKDKLLAIGDKYDDMISADKAADAPYR